MKDPAFLFYYQDFAYGTRKMSFEEKGAYIELLCEQADSGHLSLDDIKRALNSHFPIWETIREKFVEENGKFYNKVLDEHIKNRRNFVDSRLKNLNSKKNDSHMEPHMVNVNENVNVNKKVSKTSDDEFIKSLKENEAYDGINIDSELKKMDAWLSAHTGRKKTRRFIVNWLNKVEVSVNFKNEPVLPLVNETLAKMEKWEKEKKPIF